MLEHLWVRDIKAVHRPYAQCSPGSPEDFVASPEHMSFALEAKLYLFQKSENGEGDLASQFSNCSRIGEL